MNLIEICIAFVAAIISVGTPLVFQVISKFDEKYQSENIVNFFEEKSNKKLFQRILVSTVIALAAYVLVSVLFIHLNVEYLFGILQGTSYILLLNSAILVGLFIHFAFITIQFSRPTSLLNLLIQKNKLVSPKNIKIIDSIIDFSIGAIKKKDLPIFREIINHFIDVFKSIKERVGEPFPEKMYEIGYRITRELASHKHPDFDQFKYLTVNNLWILEIDNRAFDWLWRNLRIAVVNKQDEMVYAYWNRAFQYFEYKLRLPDPIYSSPVSTEKVNQEKIDIALKERTEFLDFHYYLGGFLLSENRIECIRKIWDHTNSEPPRYPLLPSAMGDIFNRYFKLCTTFDNELWEKAARFRFPKADSVNFDWVINAWIKKYLILLFLRQFTLHQYLMTQRFMELPISPKTQAERHYWLDNLPWFKERLEEYLADGKLLEALRFDKIAEDCSEMEIPTPIELINRFESQIKRDLEQAEVEQPVSEEKTNKFLSTSKILIENATKEYRKVLDLKTEITFEEYNSFYIHGKSQISSKSDFADGQGYDHINYDSFLAEGISTKIQMGISETFLTSAATSYLLKEEELFPAIDRLGVIEKPDDFVIVSFRNNINYFVDVLKVCELSSEKYKGVDIVDIWTCDSRLVGNMFFIFRSSDKPNFIFEDPKKKWKDINEPKEQIIPPEPIWASIVDLHKHPEVQQKLREQGHKEDLDDKVLVSIEMLAKISWKKTAKVVVLVLSNAYEDKGIPNKLEEVKTFDEI